MNDLISEAIEISNELPKVIVVGAVAVMLHTKRSRTSHDIDIGIAGTISNDEMIALNYISISDKRDSWYSPRQIKIDVYRKDVSGIPMNQLEKTAIKFDKKNGVIHAACVEALIITKYRAYNSRKSPNDKSDLELIINKKSKTIDRKILEELCNDSMEFELIKQMISQIQLL